jgi:putative sugar O-methyltransferase
VTDHPVTTPVDALDWPAFTQRSLDELKLQDDRYQPTSFWGPGLEELLGDLSKMGIERFKAWPSSGFWFYPRYGSSFTNATIEATFAAAKEANPRAARNWVQQALSGSFEARRDFDAMRLAWDHTRWPFDLHGLGESHVGTPTQYFRFTQQEHGWTRPYLNYLLCLAALSRHVKGPPQSVLEIGGGFGVLGEILMSRDPEVRYVDLDIPPLLTVASYYLTALFGDRVSVYDDTVPVSGLLAPTRSAVLPNWRLEDLRGDFEVFVNCYSFQEMEPHVVENYAACVAALGPEWVVSNNSRAGKPKAADGHRIGVQEPVTSARIVQMFAKHGYRLVEAFGSPLQNSAAELVILHRAARAA